jgi:tetratricopeptide (TPR) repeat protein
MAKAIALLVQAKIALAEQRPEAALEALDALRDQGIPISGMFPINVLTARAEAHVLAGRRDEAVAVHEEILRVYGGHALSHYALAVLYEDMDRFEEAAAEYEIFLDMWSEADKGLFELEDAIRRLESIKARI